MTDRGVSVRVDGLARLRRDMRKLGADLSDLKDANAAVAQLVAAAAARLAPRGRTGRLAASVRGNRAVSRATVSAGRASVPYAGPIHYGWPARGIEPQPFVHDAAQATEAAWLGVYSTAVSTAVDKLHQTY